MKFPRSVRLRKYKSPVVWAVVFYVNSLSGQTVNKTQLPVGGQVSAGQATISQSAGVMSVNQTTSQAVINWNSFNVGSGAKVIFNQPSSSSATLNRITDVNPSQILGQIVAPGQVIVLNSQGIYFGKSAVVDVGSIVATTAQMSDAAFMSGSTTYNRNGSTGSVINDGKIIAALGGYVALLAPNVQNNGIIVANLGTVVLAAGEQYQLQFSSNGFLRNVIVTGATIDTLVSNRLAVKAPGGIIIMAASAATTLQSAVVNNGGRISANGLAQQGGQVVLTASTSVINTGRITADASQGKDSLPGGPAGTITINSPQVLNNGTVSAKSTDASSLAGFAAAGNIQIQASTFTQNATGLLDVSSAGGAGGSVNLLAEDSVSISGRVLASSVSTSYAQTPVTTTASTGGTISLQAGGPMVLDNAVLDASGPDGAGVIHLMSSGQPVDPNNTQLPQPGYVAITNGSVLRASSNRGKGGQIEADGNTITLEGATLDATGWSGGGVVRVGTGTSTLSPARLVNLDSNSFINVSATGNGPGGQVVIWSDINSPGSSRGVSMRRVAPWVGTGGTSRPLATASTSLGQMSIPCRPMGTRGAG